MYFDTQTLTRLVERCFDLSMDGRLSPETRAESLAQGKRLRELLVRLLGARFDARAVEFQQATASLRATTDALDAAANNLAQVTQVVGRIAEVAGYLDKALGIAGKLIT